MNNPNLPYVVELTRDEVMTVLCNMDKAIAECLNMTFISQDMNDRPMSEWRQAADRLRHLLRQHNRLVTYLPLLSEFDVQLVTLTLAYDLDNPPEPDNAATYIKAFRMAEHVYDDTPDAWDMPNELRRLL